MRTLILRSNPIEPDPRVEKIARTLARKGHHVVCLGWDRSDSLPVQELRDGITIQRIRIRSEYGSGLQNFPALLRWQIGLSRWLFSHKTDFDIIHACDFDTIIPSMLMKWMHKKKVVYDIFDFYADHLRKTPTWIKRLIRNIDLWMINKADAVILVDDSRRSQIAGAHPKQLIIIFNSPEDVNETLEFNTTISSQISAGLTIAYVGLLQRERGLHEMLDVLQKRDRWHLDIAGFGGDEVEIKAIATTLHNVKWHGRTSYELALAISADADVLFATYDPTIENHRYSSPNKVFEAMMLGKPIIVARNTNMDRIITEERCGLVVTYGKVNELEDALEQLDQNPEFRKLLGQNARKAYETRYSWRVMSEQLIDLYDRIS